MVGIGNTRDFSIVLVGQGSIQSRINLSGYSARIGNYSYIIIGVLGSMSRWMSSGTNKYLLEEIGVRYKVEREINSESKTVDGSEY